MARLSYYFGQFMEWFQISDIRFMDIVEIVIIAAAIYRILLWIKDTKAWVLLRGVVVLAIIIALAALFNMQTILWIAKTLASIVAIALVVVFQPELRKALEKLGERKYIKSIIPNLFDIKDDDLYFSNSVKQSIVDAAFEMGEVKTGALIVVERNNILSEYTRTGILLDSLVSKQLLINIFEHNTPLHDGAVIIRDDRIVAATCYLPLSENLDISKELGTRHRSALGLSEVCDAIIIVVSEETGEVSIAQNSNITRDLTKEELINYLTEIQVIDKGLIAPVERSQDEK